MSKGTTHRTVRIEDGLWDAAKRAAVERSESLSEVIRRALMEYASESKGFSNMSDRVEAAAIEAARRAAYDSGILDPYMARASEHTDMEDLRRADADAEANNVEAWRAVVSATIAALEGARDG